MTFDAASKEPYALKSDFALNNFNTVPLFQAFDPGKPATVEGKFNVTASWPGTGLNLAQLAERTRAIFSSRARAGSCRLLQADVSDKLQKTQIDRGRARRPAGGDDRARRKSPTTPNRTKIVVDVADDWKEIPFDQLNVAIKRDDDLNIMLQDFTLISPTKRIWSARAKSNTRRARRCWARRWICGCARRAAARPRT